ncbi:MAG: polysaccharide deacetylase family protein [Coriobacteriia bacterium]|nr:polysaccharide deacetylase family protein [Coriobacteriia bacterium]
MEGSGSALAARMKFRRVGLIILSALVVTAVCGLAVWNLLRPVSVVIDGTPRTVPARTTVSKLIEAGYVAEAGSLRSVKGNVITPGAGKPPVVRIHGVPAKSDSCVRNGDVIESERGEDITEPLANVEVPIPVTTVVEGTGPIVRVVPGSPGKAKLAIGIYTREVASTITVEPVRNTTILHSPPTSADKLVALTFDDGPWPGQTDKILDILAQKQVHATFFMVGTYVQKSPGLALRVAAEGNQIGNHTSGHPDLSKQPAAAIQSQLVGGQQAIENATGVHATAFRPPYRGVNATVRQQAAALGLSVVLWDVDTLDWSRPGVNRIVSNATANTGQRMVILMHDGGGDRSQTIAALPTIIDALAARGYTFVTVDELLSVQ